MAEATVAVGLTAGRVGWEVRAVVASEVVAATEEVVAVVREVVGMVVTMEVGAVGRELADEAVAEGWEGYSRATTKGSRISQAVPAASAMVACRGARAAAAAASAVEDTATVEVVAAAAAEAAGMEMAGAAGAEAAGMEMAGAADAAEPLEVEACPAAGLARSTR